MNMLKVLLVMLALHYIPRGEQSQPQVKTWRIPTWNETTPDDEVRIVEVTAQEGSTLLPSGTRTGEITYYLANGKKYIEIRYAYGAEELFASDERLYHRVGWPYCERYSHDYDDRKDYK
jgi:hypothetical protein